MTLYVIRNHEGEYFRTKGRSGYGKSWVPDLIDAKFYAKVSQARSRVTYFTNNNPHGLPVPELIEFKVVESKVIDERERVAGAKRKKELEKQRQKRVYAERELEEARKAFEAAQKKVDSYVRGN